MQWLLALETENDPIPACRLMNVFRRKGIKIGALALAAQSQGYSLLAMIETPDADVEHIFNFLRRTEGIRDVTWYRHEPSADASFVFIETDGDSARVARFLQDFPESRLVFASHGKCLLEVGGESRARLAGSAPSDADFTPFARVKTTRDAPRTEIAAARAS